MKFWTFHNEFLDFEPAWIVAKPYSHLILSADISEETFPGFPSQSPVNQAEITKTASGMNIEGCDVKLPIHFTGIQPMLEFSAFRSH